MLGAALTGPDATTKRAAIADINPNFVLMPASKAKPRCSEIITRLAVGVLKSRWEIFHEEVKSDAMGNS